MHDDGPRVRQTFLPLVDLVQEAEDTPRLTGDSMVRPAQVLVVPDLPNQIPLGQTQRVSAPAPTHHPFPPNHRTVPGGSLGMGTLTLSSGETCKVQSLYSAVSCSLQLVTA